MNQKNVRSSIESQTKVKYNNDNKIILFQIETLSQEKEVLAAKLTGKESEVAEAKKQLEQVKAKTQDLETKLTASNTKVGFIFKKG